MSMQEQLKRGAEQGASAARENLRKGEAKAQQTFEAAQEGFQIAGDGARQVTLKLVEIARTNTEAFWSFAEELLNERDATRMVAIWTKHAQDQMEIFSRQNQELASLGQKMASTGINTISDRAR